LHKNTDWAARNYSELEVPEDSFEADAYSYTKGGNNKKNAKFVKVIRPNPIFPPYYRPVENPFPGTVGSMYDGRKHGIYDIHDRYEDQSTYDALSESMYNGYEIEPTSIGNSDGFIVNYAGDEVFFETEEEAKKFIDEVSGEDFVDVDEPAVESLTEASGQCGNYKTFTSGAMFDAMDDLVIRCSHGLLSVDAIRGYEDGLGMDIVLDVSDGYEDYDLEADYDDYVKCIERALINQYHAFDDIYVYNDDGSISVTFDEDYPIKEFMTESYGDNVANEEKSTDLGREDKEEEEVVNDKSGELVAELTDSLNRNKKLEAKNSKLQEELSVCHAKEIELMEQLNHYKEATVRLSDKAKEVKPLKESLSKKEKELTSNKKEIRSLKESVKVKLASIKEDNECNEQKISYLQEKLTSLTEELEQTSKQLESSKTLVEKYKKSYKALKESYLEAKSQSYGLNPSDVSRGLKESYKIADIDKECQKLYEQKSKLNKLPFRVDEGLQINFKQSEEYINGRNSVSSDDFVDDSLLRLANLK